MSKSQLPAIFICFRWVVPFATVLLFASLAIATEQPPKLTESAIQQLKLDGDRLADQGDYLGALKKYTIAYMGVVSAIRGQDFIESIEPNVFNREELGKEMRAMMKEDYTPEELALMDGSYKALGLVDPQLDTAELVTELLSEQVAGFYDPAKKRMVLIVEGGSTDEPSWLGKLFGASAAFDKDEQKTTLAHELTHALQDQLYGLKELQERIEDDDDMSLAFSALVEGDATLLMFVEMDDSQDVRQMDPEAVRITFNVMSWMMPLAGGESYRKAPAIFRDTLIFPYFQGMLFAVEAARRDGWESVHQIYENPPVSTEQILHPAKYLVRSRLDMPQAVKLADVTKLVPAEFKHLGGNVLGELQTAIMLKKVMGGQKAAEGWDGDRYEVYQNEVGQLALVYVSIWDSTQDAEQFEQAFRKYRSPKPTKSSSSSEGDAEQPSAPSSVERVDSTVFVVEGFSQETSEKILAKLKSETTYEEKTFPKAKEE